MDLNIKLPSLNLKHLYTFQTVYELNNFTRASQVLFLSQSTVSSQISQLEDILGTELFLRNNHHEVRPTAAGTRFYEYVLQMTAQWEEMHSAINRGEDQALIPCVIHASHTFAASILPALTGELTKGFPALAITLAMHNSEEVLEHVKQRQADLGFIEKPLSADGLERYDFAEDNLVLAGDISSGIWLMRESQSGIYHYNQMYLTENNIHPPKIICVKNNDILIRLLKNGIGAAVVSALSIEEGIPCEKLSKRYTRQFYLVTGTTVSAELVPVIEWIKDKFSIDSAVEHN